MLFITVSCCRARVWRASARTPTSTRRGSDSSSSRRRSECPGFTLLNVEFCLTNKIGQHETGICMFCCCPVSAPVYWWWLWMEDADEPLMTSLIVSTILLDCYKLWQQQYAVWMHWCCHWIWQVCPCANNAWGWQPQYILLRGDIVVVHSVHFTRTKYYVLQIFAVQSN